MGADNSHFALSVEKVTTSFTKLFGQQGESNKITLLSDTYVTEDIYKETLFSITKTISFRNITTSTGCYKYQREHKSKKHTFLKAGSVFFVDPDKKKDIEELLKNPQLQTIGYNHYK